MQKGFQDDSAQVDLFPTGFAEDTLHEAYQHEHMDVPVENKWQDVYFAVAFLVHLLITAIIFIVTMAKHDVETYEGIIPSSSKHFVPLVLKAFAASALAAAVLGYLSLLAMRAFPHPCIHGAMILNLIVLSVSAIVLGVRVAWYLGLILGLFVLLWALLYWAMWPFIPFLAELLRATSDLIMKFPSTIGLNAISVVLQFGWIMLFSYVILALQSRYGRGGVIGLTVYLLLSFFWTLQMLKNIVHTTNCGVFATWYFMQNTNLMPQTPMFGALKRTMTTSFGSVAFGSLIVAVIQTLKALASIQLDSRNGDGGGGIINLIFCLIAGCARCILSILESIALYINHYAFVVVATYGQSYIQAGKTTVAMFLRTGFLNLLNDNMLSRLQFAVCTLNSLIILYVSAGFSHWVGLSASYTGIVSGSCFFAAFLITSLIMQTLESAAATIYVCFAEDSAVLARLNPELYHRITSTFGAEIVSSGV